MKARADDDGCSSSGEPAVISDDDNSTVSRLAADAVAAAAAAAALDTRLTILDQRLRLVTFPAMRLAACMHAVVKGLAGIRTTSSSSSTIPHLSSATSNRNPHHHRGTSSGRAAPPFFSMTETESDVTILADADSVIEDFSGLDGSGGEDGAADGGWLRIEPDLFRALQVDPDQGLESSGKRISALTAPLARAGVSIFYLSTYHTDYIIVKEKSLGTVVRTLMRCGYVIPAHDLPPSPAAKTNTALPLRSWSTGSPFADGEAENAAMQRHSAAAPDIAREGSISEVPAGAARLLENSKRLEKRVLGGSSGGGLRLVGLSLDAVAEWEHPLIKLLFYSGGHGVAGGIGGGARRRCWDNEVTTVAAARRELVSFTRSEEGATLVADEELLAGLPLETQLTAGVLGGGARQRLRCVQVDLSGYGLDRYGIVWGMAQPLVERGVDLLYLSSANASHVLVAEDDLPLALETLGIGSERPRRPQPEQ
ncbi:hypothetical protein HK405_010240 [Cladochytrium tenue]|nr:hypothetical protein HK405_010240 [Cladochytrium tenue]